MHSGSIMFFKHKIAEIGFEPMTFPQQRDQLFISGLWAVRIRRKLQDSTSTPGFEGL